MPLMSWWCNNRRKTGGLGFTGYLKIHHQRFNLENSRLTDLQKNNIMAAMNKNDEPMITAKMCNAFFKNYWSNTSSVKKFLDTTKFITARKREFTNIGPQLKVTFLFIN